MRKKIKLLLTSSILATSFSIVLPSNALENQCKLILQNDLNKNVSIYLQGEQGPSMNLTANSQTQVDVPCSDLYATTNFINQPKDIVLKMSSRINESFSATCGQCTIFFTQRGSWKIVKGLNGKPIRLCEPC